MNLTLCKVENAHIPMGSLTLNFFFENNVRVSHFFHLKMFSTLMYVKCRFKLIIQLLKYNKTVMASGKTAQCYLYHFHK